jgi:hypothetical protein
VAARTQRHRLIGDRIQAERAQKLLAGLGHVKVPAVRRRLRHEHRRRLRVGLRRRRGCGQFQLSGHLLEGGLFHPAAFGCCHRGSGRRAGRDLRLGLSQPGTLGTRHGRPAGWTLGRPLAAELGQSHANLRLVDVVGDLERRKLALLDKVEQDRPVDLVLLCGHDVLRQLELVGEPGRHRRHVPLLHLGLERSRNQRLSVSSSNNRIQQY